MKKSNLVRLLIITVLVICLSASGCGSSSKDSQLPPDFSPPRVLVPEAPGSQVLGEAVLTLDISNMSQGYLTALSEADDKRSNVQLLAPDGTLYSYFIEAGESAVIPFSGGSGQYQITCYQQISDSQYAALFAQSLDVTLDNEFLPYIYPNQYVNFTPDSEASTLALSMAGEDTSDLDALDAIYTYVTENITYDYELAETVDAGYLPDVDATLASGTGICFDYAALMTAMLRSLDIPCKLQIGYSGEIKHAWVDVYLKSKGWVEKAAFFDGDTWGRMDPTFASGSTDDSINEYIGDGDNYTVQFTR